MVVWSHTKAQQHVDLLLDRTSRIDATDVLFKFNHYSDYEALSTYRFRLQDIAFLVSLISWPAHLSLTSRNRYAKSQILATCIVMRRIEVPDIWKYLFFLFGKHTYQLSEMFLETRDYFVAARGSLLLKLVPWSHMEPLFSIFSMSIKEKCGAVDTCGGLRFY